MTLAALVADLGHPRIRYSEHLTIEGSEGWARVLAHCPPLTPAEERQLLELLLAHAGVNLNPLPSWVSPELAATEAARTRLRAWAAAGSPPVTADDVCRRCQFIGDEGIEAIVRAALLEKIAPPAARFLLDEVLWVGTGWSSGGWCSQTALSARVAASGRLRIIAISGHSQDAARVHDYVTHEAAHAWLCADAVRPLRPEALSNEKAAYLLRAARDETVRTKYMHDLKSGEAEADTLARTWGGRLYCTAERDAAHDRELMAQLDEVYGDTVAASLAAASLPATEPKR